jgi:hypothetical protein
VSALVDLRGGLDERGALAEVREGSVMRIGSLEIGRPEDRRPGGCKKSLELRVSAVR